MSQFEKAKQYIQQNLKTDDGALKSLWVHSKRTGEDYCIAQQYNSYDGWFVYEGCELVVGDVTFDYAVQALLDVTR